MRLRLSLLLGALLVGTTVLAGGAAAGEAGIQNIAADPGSRTTKAVNAFSGPQKADPGDPRISEERSLEIIRAAFTDLDLGGWQPEFSLDMDNYQNKMVWRVSHHHRRPGPGPGSGFWASVDANSGEIQSFSRNETAKAAGDRIITRDEARVIAENLAKRLQPIKFRLLQLQKDEHPRFHEPMDSLNIVYHFQWSRIINGIPVENDGIGISVDALSGRVVNYHFSWNGEFDLPPAGEVQPAEKMAKKLLNELGMTLSYQVPFGDYTGSTPRARLVYGLNNPYSVTLDAMTGEFLDHQGKAVEFKAFKQFENIPQTAGDMNPPEPGSKRISYQEALEKANNFFKSLGYDGEVDRQGSGSGGGPLGREEYWSFGLKSEEGRDIASNANVGIDVFTGRVAHFHGRGRYLEGQPSPLGKTLNGEEAAKAAREFINKVEPELSPYLVLQNMPEWEKGRFMQEHYLNFSRVVNGVPFPQDGVHIAFGQDGKVINYNCQWHRVIFPPAGAKITPEDAAAKWLALAPLKLKYIFTRDDQYRPLTPRLVYQSEFAGIQFLDANTGEAMSYDGRPIKKASGNGYDFSGSWAEQHLQLMADSRLLPSPDEFSHTGHVSRREGLRLIMAASSNYYYDEALVKTQYFQDVSSEDSDFGIFKRAADSGVIEKGGQLLPQENLTRATLAAWLVNALGHKDAAMISNRIESPFNDLEGLSLQERNYIGLVNGMGLLAGDETRDFRPSDFVTWEELAAAVLKAAPKLRNRNIW